MELEWLVPQTGLAAVFCPGRVELRAHVLGTKALEASGGYFFAVVKRVNACVTAVPVGDVAYTLVVDEPTVPVPATARHRPPD